MRLVWCGVVCVVLGSSITTFASTFGGFMLGRTFVGLGCGCGVMLTPVYLGTCIYRIDKDIYTTYNYSYLYTHTHIHIISPPSLLC